MCPSGCPLFSPLLCALLVPVMSYRIRLDCDPAMYDLRGHHWPPKYAHGCGIPATSQHTENVTRDVFDVCTNHTRVQPTLFTIILWVFGLREMLIKRGASGRVSREALMLAELTLGAFMLRKLRRAATERMVG